MDHQQLPLCDYFPTQQRVILEDLNENLRIIVLFVSPLNALELCRWPTITSIKCNTHSNRMVLFNIFSYSPKRYFCYLEYSLQFIYYSTLTLWMRLMLNHLSYRLFETVSGNVYFIKYLRRFWLYFINELTMSSSNCEDSDSLLLRYASVFWFSQ